MTNCAKSLLILLFLMGLQAGGVQAEAKRIEEPYKLMRMLDRIEDEIIRGDQAAIVKRGEVLNRLAKAFDQLGSEGLSNTRTQIAAIVFVLSGGQPIILRNILAQVEEDSDLGPVMRAIVFSFSGRVKQALKELDEVKLRSLPGEMAGRVAMFKATLVSRTAPERAINLLDEARLLGRGSIIEQDALRAQSVLLKHTGGYKRFLGVMRRYVTKFAVSAYDPKHNGRLIEILVTFDYKTEKTSLTDLEGVLATFVPRRRKEVRISAAQVALRKGNLWLAQGLASNALKAPKQANFPRTQLKLYLLASDVVLNDTKKAMADLRTIDANQLTLSDRLLLAGSLMIGRHILEREGSQISCKQCDYNTDMDVGRDDDKELRTVLKNAKQVALAAEQLLGDDKK